MNKNLLLLIAIVAIGVVILLFFQMPTEQKNSIEIKNTLVFSSISKSSVSIAVEYRIDQSHSISSASSFVKDNRLDSVNDANEHTLSLKEYRQFYKDRVTNMPEEKVKKELPPPPPFPSVE